MKESRILLKRYDNKTYNLIKRCIKIASNYEKNYPEDVYKFVQAISQTKEDVVFEGCKQYANNEFHHPKGLKYCKHIILNINKNKEKTIKNLQKRIGGKAKPLIDYEKNKSQSSTTSE